MSTSSHTDVAAHRAPSSKPPPMSTSPLAVPTKIRIDASSVPGGGRGVFATASIEAGECIEQCPVIALENPKDRARLRKTGLVNYYFLWGEKRDRAALCLGWGSVYNHSFQPNARFEKRIQSRRMDFVALRAIAPGEEILVNYNGDPNDTTPVLMPGLPAPVGGMPEYRTPRFVRSVTRRVRLMLAWLTTRPTALVILSCAGGA